MRGSLEPSGPLPTSESASDGSAAHARSDLLHRWSLRLEGAGGAVPSVGGSRAATAAAVAGIAFVILYVVAFVLLAQVPQGDATDAVIVAYYESGENLALTLAAMYAMPFAGIFFLYFMAMMRAAVAATGIRVSRALGHVQFAAGILFVGMLFVGTACLVATPASIRLTDDVGDTTVARMLPTVSMTVLLMFGLRMAAMFVFVTSSVGRAAGLIPRWFALAGYLVGALLLLAFSLATWFAVLFAAWVLALCCLTIWRHLQTAPGS